MVLIFCSLFDLHIDDEADIDIDVQMLTDGSIDINALDPSESVSLPSLSAFGSALTPKPGLRGWQPQSEDQSCEDIGQPDSEPRSRGRSVIERLESMEKMQRTMAEWCEKMKDREADLRLEGQNVDGERKRSEVAAEMGKCPLFYIWFLRALLF